MAPGLDQKGLGDPIKPGQEIAEAEPEPGPGRRISARAPGCACWAWQPSSSQTSSAEGEEQHRPGMDRRKGEHRDGAGNDGKQRAARARQARDPSRRRAPSKQRPSLRLDPRQAGRARSGPRARRFTPCSRPSSSWRRHMDAELLDPPRVGFQHLELDAAWMTHQLAARRDAAGDGEHQAAERVDVLFLLARDQLNCRDAAPAPRSACARRRSGRGEDPSRISGSSSTSCSSAISPTTSSTRSSIETSPSVPPYSSTTSAR